VEKFLESSGRNPRFSPFAMAWKAFVRFGDPDETEVERAAGRAGFD
jgi:hypothetical protein